jgi:hypothetical protein
MPKGRTDKEEGLSLKPFGLTRPAPEASWLRLRA